MIVLKEEINQLSDQIFKLAQWKLIVVGSFAVVGLGWGDIKADQNTGSLLLCSVGFLCAYIDSLYYRRAMSIHVIASFLREYQGDDEEMKELKKYENIVNEKRTERGSTIISDKWPQFISSIVFTIVLPIVSVLQKNTAIAGWLILITVIALLLNIILFVLYTINRKDMLY